MTSLPVKTTNLETWEEAAAFAWHQTFDGATTDSTVSFRGLYDSGRYRSIALKARDELVGFFAVGKFVNFLAGKQHDYGPENVLRFGKDGLKVRLWDKIARYENLKKRAGTKAVNESLEDTLKDMIGYVLIMVMLDYGIFELPLSVDVSAKKLTKLPKPDTCQVSVANTPYDQFAVGPRWSS